MGGVLKGVRESEKRGAAGWRSARGEGVKGVAAARIRKGGNLVFPLGARRRGRKSAANIACRSSLPECQGVEVARHNPDCGDSGVALLARLLRTLADSRTH